MTTFTSKFTTICSVAVLALGMAACGGGGNGDDGPGPDTGMNGTPMPAGGSPLAFSALQGGEEVMAGRYHLTDAPEAFLEALGEVEQPQGGYAPGAMVAVGGLELHCADAGAGNCSVTVHDDGSFTVAGTILVVAADGTPPVATLPPPDPAVVERMAIDSAIAMARTAVAGVNDDSTDSEVGAAETAVADARDAVDAGTSLPADLIAAHNATVMTLESQLNAAKESRTAAIEDATDEERMAMAETGKALHAALAGPAEGDMTVLDNAAVGLTDAGGLMVTAAEGAGAIDDGTTPPVVTLDEGDSAGSLGGWAGTHYAHTNTGTKVVNAALVYTNQGAPEREPFDDVYTVEEENAGDVPAFTAIKGSLTVVSDGAVDEDADLADVTGTAFTHSGTQNHAVDDDTGVFLTRGYYDGAPGQYRCTGTTCSSTNDGEGGPSVMTGTWHFKPDAGAMVSQPDDTYLYYGWWLSKDKDGDPTAASAFAGVVAPGTTDAADALRSGTGETLTGSATYAGHAAGKFAMSNPLDGTGSGGHFTADATLTAKFGAIAAGGDNGVTGVIDNFMANDESVPWSVKLNQSSAWGTNGEITGPTSDATVWSIDGNEAPASGAWSGQMYDELPGDAPDGDGSTVPTTVTGTFYSEFSTIGRMVGGFGADKH